MSIGALDEIVRELLEGLARQRVRWRWSASLRPLEMMNGQVHLGLADARELTLRFFRRVLEALERHAVLAEIDPVLLFEALETSQSMMRASMSSPPRNVSPAVAMTLKTPCAPISRIEMSKVPPPKS